jgi:hypothetical protein
LRDAHQNFITESRPWILPTAPRPFRIEVNQPLSLDIVLVNYGKYPARDAHAIWKLAYGEKALQTVHRLEPDLSEPGLAPIPPNGGIGNTMTGGVFFSALLPSDKIRVTKQVVDFLNSHDFALVAYGTVNYSDNFGKRHETEFCFARLANGTIANCNGHNYMD